MTDNSELPQSEPAEDLESPSVGLDQKDRLLMEETLSVLQEVSESPDQPTHYMHLVMDLLHKELGITREELEDPDLQESIQEQFEQMSVEARELARSYELDALVAETTLENLDNFKKNLEAKVEAKRLEKFRRKLEKIVGVDFQEMTLLGEDQYQLRFQQNGIDVALIIAKKVHPDYGTSYAPESLKCDQNNIRLPKSFFRRGLGVVSQLTKDYSTFWDSDLSKHFEWSTSELHYDDGSFFILSDSEMEGVSHVIKTPETDEYHYFDASGLPLFEEILREDGQIRFEIFDAQGDRVQMYSEWLEAEGFTNTRDTRERYAADYLAPRLQDDAILDRFFAKKMRYTSDVVDAKGHISMVPDPSALGLGRVYARNEKWQTWEETLEREADGAYLGDCDDYAFLAQKINTLNGKTNAHVLAIPMHATAISLAKNEDGTFTAEDIGTFQLLSVTAPTAEAAMQQLLDRYQGTGLGFWQGQSLTLNPSRIDVLGTKFDRERGTFEGQLYQVSVEELIDPEKMETIKAIEDRIFQRDYEGALEQIDSLPIERKNNALIHHLTVVCYFSLGRKDEALKTVRSYVEERGSKRQEDYEIFLGLTDLQDKQWNISKKAIAIVEEMARNLDVISFSNSLRQILFYGSPISSGMFKLALKIKPKIVEEDRVEFLSKLVAQMSSEHGEAGLSVVRELLDSINSSYEIHPFVATQILEGVRLLPIQERLDYAAKFLDNNPSDPVFNRLFFDNLIEGKKHDLAIYLLETGQFDEIVDPDARTLLIAQQHAGVGRYAQAIEVLGANLPSESFGLDLQRMRDQFEIYHLLRDCFLKDNPQEAVPFFDQQVDADNASFNYMPIPIMRELVHFKYLKKPITHERVHEDYEALKARLDNRMHRFAYLYQIISELRHDRRVPISPKVRDYLKQELTIINEEMLAKHPRSWGSNVTWSESDERRLVAGTPRNRVEKLIDSL
jgi:hypothetical protein